MVRATIYIIFSSIFLVCSCSTNTVTGSSSSVENRVEVRKSAADEKSSTLVQFETSGKMSPAMTKARDSGKMIFLDFYSDKCPPCKLMDEEVFSDEEIAGLLNQNFINVKVDGTDQDGANLGSMFGVRAFPTLVFTNASGKVLVQKEGGVSASHFRSLIQDAMQSTAMN